MYQKPLKFRLCYQNSVASSVILWCHFLWLGLVWKVTVGLFWVNAVFQGLALKITFTLNCSFFSCFLLLFFFFYTKVEVLNGMMTSLPQSHPLYQRQLIALLALNHLFSQSTSLHLLLPGLSTRTGHIHPLTPDSLFLLQTWQAFPLRILQIQI